MFYKNNINSILRFFTIIFLFLGRASYAQTYPNNSYYEPYKYPKHYTYDGANKIIDFMIYPKMNDKFGWGGNIKSDIISLPIGTKALNLNFGTGVGLLSIPKSKIEFENTETFNGVKKENFIESNGEIFNIQMYSRLWVRVSNPINISILVGFQRYWESKTIKGSFSVPDVNYGFHTKDYNYKSSTANNTWFYEIKGMYNFHNFGLNAGFTNLHFPQSKLQFVAGIWFGLNKYVPVIN